MSPHVDIGDEYPGRPHAYPDEWGRTWMTRTSGCKYTKPGGDAEHATQAKSRGMEWCAIGVMDEPNTTLDKWQTVIDRHRAVGMKVVAGGRVYTPGQLHLLIERAVTFGLDDALPNIENELMTMLAPAVVEATIRAARDEFDVPDDWLIGINTVSRLYSIVDYRPIHHRPTLLQMYGERAFPDLPVATGDLLRAAWDNGFRDLQPTFMVEYAQPGDVAFWKGKPRSYFTGNSLGSNEWPVGWAVT